MVLKWLREVAAPSFYKQKISPLFNLTVAFEGNFIILCFVIYFFLKDKIIFYVLGVKLIFDLYSIKYYLIYEMMIKS